MTRPDPSTRITIIDALRGFALAGIVLVHMTENYLGAAAPETFTEGTHDGVLDYIVDGLVILFLRGKFFALFSFLFGLSFFIQMDRSHARGIDFRGRFVWRLVLLLIIGYLHHLFYRGDILTIYATLGLFLIPFYKIKNTYIWAIAAILFLGLGRFVVFTVNPQMQLFLEGDFSPMGAETLAYYQLLKNGELWAVMWDNATVGMLSKLDFQLGILSRGYLTFGFFLLGLYVGRDRWFKRFRDKTLPLTNLMWTGGILFCVGIALAALGFAQMGPEVTFDNWNAMIGLTGMDLNNLGMTLIIFVLFIWAYRKSFWERLLRSFAPYGRMALTNYVVQSLLGTFLFYGWGLGYLGEIPNRYTFLMGFAIIGLQMVLSHWWLKVFHYGPLEWLWRSATYLKWYPLMKSRTA